MSNDEKKVKQFVKNSTVSEIAEAINDGTYTVSEIAKAANKKVFVASWLQAKKGKQYSEKQILQYLCDILGESSRATAKAYVSWAKRPDKKGKCPFSTRLQRDDDEYKIVSRENSTM